jgi:hypothetical protein
MKYRKEVFIWLCSIADYSMTLDIPVWTVEDPNGSVNANIKSYDDAITATKINHEYFIVNNTKHTKFLNVLQGRTHAESDDWYMRMKHYNDPAKFDHPFKGWGFGGRNVHDVHLLLRRVVTLIHDGLLQEGENDWIHVLGMGKLLWGVMLTKIQRSIRATHNPNLTISFDAASPFLSTVNGNCYTGIGVDCSPNKSKWSFLMDPTIDNKKLYNDTRPFKQAVLADGIHKQFTDSPISKRLTVKDICVYSPTCANKQGNVNKTSWDSLSYLLLMAHNTFIHIDGIQTANQLYDTGCMPAILVNQLTGITFNDIIDELFDTTDLQKQYDILNNHTRFFNKINKSINATTMINALFDWE